MLNIGEVTLIINKLVSFEADVESSAWKILG